MMRRLIETIRVKDGTAPLWPLHMARLARSCEALGIPRPALTPPRDGERVLRLEVGIDGVTVSERPVPLVAPITLAVVPVRHPGYPHKTTVREAFQQAYAAARRVGADDALLLGEGGVVAETSIWALFWWDGERLAAPPLALGILPSVARARIEALAGPVTEQQLTPRAAGLLPLFAANAVRGIVPVARLDSAQPPLDSRTTALAARFWP